eukprot:TRINITY_DN139199_c0_g1_i1.p1 TRINITY_DN139199_c0_g1~~TRINITY_DN139199_c0_g1_i1.p1  ORF type:complete len:189 (-),score=19.48 TRINITY_DN139199_c0_g1_i1:164-730(-)
MMLANGTSSTAQLGTAGEGTSQRRANQNAKKAAPALPYPLREEWKELSLLKETPDYDSYPQIGTIQVIRDRERAGIVRWKLDQQVLSVMQMEIYRGFKGYSDEFSVPLNYSEDTICTKWRLGWGVSEEAPGLITVTLTCVEAQESVLNQIEARGRLYIIGIRRWINFNHLFWVDYPEAVIFHCMQRSP